MIYYQNPDSSHHTYGIMSRTGKIIHDFGYCNGIYIDEYHNRLLAEKFINNDSTAFIAYDAKTFERIQTKYVKIKIDQSFDAYLKQERGKEITDSTGYQQLKIEYQLGETEEFLRKNTKNSTQNLPDF